MFHVQRGISYSWGVFETFKGIVQNLEFNYKHC